MSIPGRPLPCHGRATARERFLRKVELIPFHTCWEWMGCLSTHGYGMFRMAWPENAMNAHRASWLIHVGVIPDGLFVLHKCDNRSCVNPDHLYLGTVNDNFQDWIKRGRGRVFLMGDTTNRYKTHCPKGHPYEGNNIYHMPRGGRQCRQCARDRHAAKKHARGVPSPAQECTR